LRNCVQAGFVSAAYREHRHHWASEAQDERMTRTGSSSRRVSVHNHAGAAADRGAAATTTTATGDEAHTHATLLKRHCFWEGRVLRRFRSSSSSSSSSADGDASGEVAATQNTGGEEEGKSEWRVDEGSTVAVATCLNDAAAGDDAGAHAAHLHGHIVSRGRAYFLSPRVGGEEEEEEEDGDAENNTTTTAVSHPALADHAAAATRTRLATPHVTRHAAAVAAALRRGGELPTTRRHFHTQNAASPPPPPPRINNDADEEPLCTVGKNADTTQSSSAGRTLQAKLRARPPRRTLAQTTSAETKTVELLIINDKGRYDDAKKRSAIPELEAAASALILRHINTAANFAPAIDVVLVGQITWLHADPYDTPVGPSALCPSCGAGEVGATGLMSSFNSYVLHSLNTKQNKSYSLTHLYTHTHTHTHTLYPLPSVLCRYAPVVEAAGFTYDSAHLLSHFDLQGKTVGFAGLGQMCRPGRSSAIIQTRGFGPVGVAVIMAHEMGHSFGMTHDGDAQGGVGGFASAGECDPEGFIMSTSLGISSAAAFAERGALLSLFVLFWRVLRLIAFVLRALSSLVVFSVRTHFAHACSLRLHKFPHSTLTTNPHSSCLFAPQPRHRRRPPRACSRPARTQRWAPCLKPR
jgi:hypothetical protein